MSWNTTPVNFIGLGGAASTPANPSGFAYRTWDPWQFRHWLTDKLLASPWPRVQLCTPYGNAQPPTHPNLGTFSCSPYGATDIAPWIRSSIRDACKEAQGIRPELKIDFHIGFASGGPTKYVPDHILTTNEVDWFVKSCKAWRAAGLDGKLALDASSVLEFAPIVNAILAKWVTKDRDFLYEGLPCTPDGQNLDLARLAQYGGWCRREWHPARLTSLIAPPAPYGECVVVWNFWPATPEEPPAGYPPTVKDMQDFISRGFVLGGDERYHAAMREAMAT